jgi:hypothetical protein
MRQSLRVGEQIQQVEERHRDTGWLTLHYGYLDESGDIVPFSGSRYLVVVVLVARDPRPVELHIKRARQGLGRKARADELKAADLETSITERLLKALVEEDIEIVAVVVNKRAILRPPNAEDIYQIRGVKAPVFRHGDETPPAGVNRRGKTVAETIDFLEHLCYSLV